MEDTGLLKLETSDLERGAKRISMPEDTGSYCSVKLETSELEIKAKNILEYTGLSGHQLELKLKSFSDHHGQKEPYTEQDIIRKSALINDPIFGGIKLHPLLENIINTPEFFRLKNVKQLGGACHVYPGSNHTRFEHSIGVSYIAEVFITHLRKQHPSESDIELKDILCVQVAGLCHDLGQGPFSHVFEELIVNRMYDCKKIPERLTTKMSVLIFRKILRDRLKVLSSFIRSELTTKDVKFIEEMIDHDDDFCPQGREDVEQRFFYEIVFNRKTGIDADKFDCLIRDCHYLGITINFKWRRLIELSYIVGGKGEGTKRHVGFRNKEIDSIQEMFHMHCSLTSKAYKHKTVHALEMMIAEAIVLCKDIELFYHDPSIAFSSDEWTSQKFSSDSLLAVEAISVQEAVESALKALEDKELGQCPNFEDLLLGYLSLNDNILDQIKYVSIHDRKRMQEEEKKNSRWSDYVKAQELIFRIENRKIYKLALFKTFPNQRKEVNEKDLRVKKLQELIHKDLLRKKIAQQSSQFSPDDIHVEMVEFTFGTQEDTDPLKNVLFVAKDDLTKPNPNEFEKASPLVRPEEFTEYKLRVYTKKMKLKKKDVKKAFESWYHGSDCELASDHHSEPKSKFPHEIIGDVETYKCGQEGGSFPLDQHGIRIIIPPGAVEKKTEFEFAVCLTGPFTFPENKCPVSPILWICTNDNRRFKQPIQIVIPHIFQELSAQDVTELEITFTKADHTTDVFLADDGSKMYTFKEIKELSIRPHFEGGCGTLSLHHCCYLCIQAKDISPSVAAKAAYCLSRYQSSNGTRSSITFCATYQLQTCLTALDGQFPAYSKVSPKSFKFHEENDPHLFVSINGAHELNDIIVATDPEHCKIFASDIDYWKRFKDGEDLKLLHQQKMYPPRITFEVDHGSSDAFKLKFSFTGCINSHLLNADVLLPIIPSSSVQMTSAFAAATSNIPKFNVSNLMVLHCKGREIYKVIDKIKHEWKTIGYLLGTEYATIESLPKKNFYNTAQCLCEVISKWIQKGECRDQTEYQPTWEGFCTILVDIEQRGIVDELKNIFSTQFNYHLEI